MGWRWIRIGVEDRRTLCELTARDVLVERARAVGEVAIPMTLEVEELTVNVVRPRERVAKLQQLIVGGWVIARAHHLPRVCLTVPRRERRGERGEVSVVCGVPKIKP